MLDVSQNIAEMAHVACTRLGMQTAYTCLGAALSFYEWDRLSSHAAAWLVHEHGLQPGDRVAIQLPNLLQYPVLALAVLKAQGVIVNLNPLYTSKEIEPVLQDSGATLLVVLANLAHNAAAAVVNTQVKSVIVCEVGDMLGTVRGGAINFLSKHFRRQIKPFHFAHGVKFKYVLAQGKRLAQQRSLQWQYSPERLAVLQYTGGTTGVPKAAMLSHRNLLVNIFQLDASLQGDCPSSGAVMLAPLPFYHIYGFSLSLIMLAYKGHHALLVPNPRDTSQMLKLMRKYKIAGFLGINTLYKNVMAHADFDRVDFSQLQISTSGGMALADSIAHEWHQHTGVRILEGYGLTECSPMVAANTYSNYKQGTVGKAGIATELLLLKLNGEQAAIGEPGEICVKGPQVMQGYWHNPAETARAIDVAGWLHTGDIGVLDAEGYLRIVDRIKDVIMVSGFNVYPNEIENHLASHPEVVDACAINVGDELNSCIKVYIVSRNPQLTAAAVLNYCRQGLTSYKVPKQVEFRDSLPKSLVGKVLRRQLREEHQRGAVNAG